MIIEGIDSITEYAAKLHRTQRHYGEAMAEIMSEPLNQLFDELCRNQQGSDIFVVPETSEVLEAFGDDEGTVCYITEDGSKIPFSRIVTPRVVGDVDEDIEISCEQLSGMLNDIIEEIREMSMVRFSAFGPIYMFRPKLFVTLKAYSVEWFIYTMGGVRRD